MKIAIILGTRPEIIKMSPIIFQCQEKGLDHFVIHTGQHYSYMMDSIFFHELGIPRAKYKLDPGYFSRSEQLKKMFAGIEEILLKERPDVVLVEGDTNTVLAGGLAAYRHDIKIGHVEAGLRCFDKKMIEEKNRVIVDHISDYLFAPTVTSKKNLLEEGLGDERIYVTGNTIVDAVYRYIDVAGKDRDAGGLKEYMIATVHRKENVDDPERLRRILDGFEKVFLEFGMPVVFAIHPGTEKRIKGSGFKLPEGIKLVGSPGYLEFLRLESNARVILTDSGGVQEEASILGVPCVTLRDSTERPETVDAGANIIAGTGSEDILDAVRTSMGLSGHEWNGLYGDGNASRKIIDILENKQVRSRVLFEEQKKGILLRTNCFPEVIV